MSYKYIGYLPTPRAGSKSITHALINAGVYSRDDINDIPNGGGFFLSVSTLTAKDKMFPRWWESAEVCQSIALFTVLRNPYDRVVSAWLHSVKQKWVPESITLPEFCDFLTRFYTGQYLCADGESMPQAALRYYAGWPGTDFDTQRSAFMHAASWECQKHSVLDFKQYPDELKAQLMRHCVVENYPSPPLAQFPKALRPGMIILPFENLKEEIAKLSESFGWPQLELPHLNNSQCHDYSVYHTPETLEFVKLFYSTEIWLGGYTGPGSWVRS